MIAVGQTLPNGAVVRAVVQVSQEDGRPYGIVLCKRAGDNTYEPYVTWALFLDDPGSTHTGHYYDDFHAAWHNFSHRLENAR